MNVRPVKPQEYEEAGRVTSLAYREFLPADPHQNWLDYLRSIADVAGRADRTVVLAAVEDGRILGTATLEVTEGIGDEAALEPGAANLRMLGVDPAFREQGVGRALVEACLDLARKEGKRSVTLHTAPFMSGAQRLYEGMGFVREPDRDHPLPDGNVLMGYRLKL